MLARNIRILRRVSVPIISIGSKPAPKSLENIQRQMNNITRDLENIRGSVDSVNRKMESQNRDLEDTYSMLKLFGEIGLGLGVGYIIGSMLFLPKFSD